MRPAGASPDTREIIIALITIRFQVSVRKTIKEINCNVSRPCFSVMVKDDRWQSIFTRAEQPHERISFGISFRLLQYLYSCLICHVIFCSFFDTFIIPQRALEKKQKCQYFQGSFIIRLLNSAKDSTIVGWLSDMATPFIFCHNYYIFFVTILQLFSATNTYNFPLHPWYISSIRLLPFFLILKQNLDYLYNIVLPVHPAASLHYQYTFFLFR